MRTTITIDDHLFDELERRAAERDTTVSRLIEDSVRAALARSPEPPSASDNCELVTFGRGGRFTEVDIDRTSVLLNDLEREVWPAVPRELLGRGVPKEEQEELLGYGREGV